MSRIVIIGAGIVGLSVARAAFLRGHEVHVLEQGPVPNPRSASFDRHRMIRPHYGRALGYARMVTPAFAAWDRLWQDLGACHFEDTGGLAIGLQPGDYARQTVEAFEALGIPHDVLDAAAVLRLCPHLRLPDDAWGVLAHPAGPLFADRIVADLAAWLEGQGAVIEPETRVARIDVVQGWAERADGSRVSGDALVIAAGAWLPELMPETHGGRPVHRQALCYVEPPSRFAQSWRDGPAIVAIGDGGGYTLPDRRGAGLKFGYGGHRRRGRPGDGFAFDFEAESTAILRPFAPFLQDAEAYRPVRMDVWYYVIDETRRFRIEADRRAVVVTNCDGQMFKFGPLLGERIMAMIDGKESSASLARWAAGEGPEKG
ncbi:NAD(P)/FAD-dependent oxidoreductase [Marinivivus vitaminiproducens]|uniref:NAD(P)/FAD-dependent oxidoreductase n=1 Tax=Marinivivus vitaminiproducens TaxID=3035935 RepID=UPI0027992324|nr:FAD-dependent oxidoreductase [Geminicoccaceae bacterium SCSIO 64248]